MSMGLEIYQDLAQTLVEGPEGLTWELGFWCDLIPWDQLKRSTVE